MSKNLFTIPKLTYYAQIFQLDGIIDIQLSPTFSCLFYLLESILKFSIYLVQIEFPPYRGRKRERGELLLLTINSGLFVPFFSRVKVFQKKVFSVNQLVPRVFKKKKKKKLSLPISILDIIITSYRDRVKLWPFAFLLCWIDGSIGSRISRKKAGWRDERRKEKERRRKICLYARDTGTIYHHGWGERGGGV